MAGPIRFQANQDGEILLNLNKNGRKPAEVAALRALKPALFREWHNYIGGAEAIRILHFSCKWPARKMARC